MIDKERTLYREIQDARPDLPDASDQNVTVQRSYFYPMDLRCRRFCIGRWSSELMSSDTVHLLSRYHRLRRDGFYVHYCGSVVRLGQAPQTLPYPRGVLSQRTERLCALLI